MRAWALGIVAAALLVPAVASAAPGGEGTVTPSQVGSLRFGVATDEDVVAFAGEPDVVFDDPGYGGEIHKVLGYFCRTESGAPRCQTVYGIDAAGNRLVNFHTSSRRFRTRRGTRVGHQRRTAEKRERRKARGTCRGWSITIGGPRRSLAINVGTGPKGRRVQWLSVIGPGGGSYFSC